MLEFNIFADYFQFYIQDEAADGTCQTPGPTKQWTSSSPSAPAPLASGR